MEKKKLNQEELEKIAGSIAACVGDGGGEKFPYFILIINIILDNIKSLRKSIDANNFNEFVRKVRDLGISEEAISNEGLKEIFDYLRQKKAIL